MTVFFDLDDTLLDETGLMHEALRQVAEELRLQHPWLEPDALILAYTAASDEVWRRIDPSDAQVTIDAIRRWSWESALQRLGAAASVETCLERYRAARTGRVRLHTDALTTLDALAAAGSRLGLITNGEARTQRWKLATTGLAARFDPIVISQEVGAAKPDVRIFQEAARRAGTPCEKCVMIGDLLHTDIRGARASGMQAVWINRAGVAPIEEQPDHTVTDLRQVVTLLISR